MYVCMYAHTHTQQRLTETHTESDKPTHTERLTQRHTDTHTETQ
jgi:hypothetical protein